MAPPDRPALAPGDWDGMTRARAVRRLLELAETERTLYAPSTWVRRLWALLRVLVVSLTGHR